MPFGTKKYNAAQGSDMTGSKVEAGASSAAASAPVRRTSGDKENANGQIVINASAGYTPEQQVMVQKKTEFLNEFNDYMYRELGYVCDIAAGRVKDRKDMLQKIGGGFKAFAGMMPDGGISGGVSIAAALFGAAFTVLGKEGSKKRIRGLYEELMELRKEKGSDSKHSLQALIHEAGVMLADRYEEQIYYGKKPAILAQTAVSQAFEYIGATSGKLTPEMIVFGVMEGRSGAGVEGFLNRAYEPVETVKQHRDWTTQGALRRTALAFEDKHGSHQTVSIQGRSRPSKYGAAHVDPDIVKIYQKQKGTTVELLTTYDQAAMERRQRLPIVRGYVLTAEEKAKLSKKAPTIPGWAGKAKPVIKLEQFQEVAKDVMKEQLSALYTTLEPEIDGLKRAMERIQQQVNEHGERLDTLESLVAEHDRRIGKVEERVDDLSTDMSKVKIDVDTMLSLEDIFKREAQQAREGDYVGWQEFHKKAVKMGAPFDLDIAKTKRVTALIGACNPWGRRAAIEANINIMAEYKGNLQQAVCVAFESKEAIVNELLDMLEAAPYPSEKKKAYINQLGINGKACDTALANAVMWGHWPIVERLLKMGADPMQDQEIILGNGKVTNIWSIAGSAVINPYKPEQDCHDPRPGAPIDRLHVLWLIEQKAVEQEILEMSDCQFYGSDKAKTYALLHAKQPATTQSVSGSCSPVLAAGVNYTEMLSQKSRAAALTAAV